MKLHILTIILLLIASFGFSQEKTLPKGWDQIILEGKKAYMNLITGEVSSIFPTKPALKPVRVSEYDPTIIHVVQKGETLSSIARKHNITLDKIYQLNHHFDYDTVEVGKEIVVGYKKDNTIQNDEIVTTSTKPVIEKKYISTIKRVSKAIHKVQKGETLYSISKMHGLTVDELKRINYLKDNTIFLGQKLYVE